VLTIENVSVRYGRAVQALHDVSFEVADGEVVAVLGSNGAGKSTLLRAISATLALHGGTVTSGSVTLDGTRLDTLDPAAIVRRRLMQVPEGRQVFGRMTVEENLRVGGLAAEPRRREAAKARGPRALPGAGRPVGPARRAAVGR
jgi:branched-chain amino acid transport system ATP-binding protein